MIISPEAVQKFGADLQRNAGRGTGPFQFVEWVKDDHIMLKRFDGYWDKQGGPYLDRIRYRPDPRRHGEAPEPDRGEIDVMDYVKPRDVAMLKGNRNVVEVDVPSLATFGYQLNHTKPPFDNKALRQAVAHGSTSRRSSRASGSASACRQRADPALELGVRQLDPADQARRGEGQGEARRGRQAGRLHLHA